MWVDFQTGGTLLWNPCGPSTTVWTTVQLALERERLAEVGVVEQVLFLNSTLTV